MTISDQLAARLRTAWPMLLGWAAAWLLTTAAPVVTWLDDSLGIEVTQAQVAAGLGVVLGYGVYEAGRWLERRTGSSRYAILARLAGRWLLSVGLYTGQPTYVPPAVETRTSASGSALHIRSGPE